MKQDDKLNLIDAHAAKAKAVIWARDLLEENPSDDNFYKYMEALQDLEAIQKRLLVALALSDKKPETEIMDESSDGEAVNDA